MLLLPGDRKEVELTLYVFTKVKNVYGLEVAITAENILWFNYLSITDSTKNKLVL